MPDWYKQVLWTPNPQGDVAFLMLDRVFGFKGIFGSCADPSIACPANLHFQRDNEPWPSPFHTGLHALFNIYNLGVAIVGFVIFLYLVVTVVAETAQTGIPFGERFQVWAVPRLILAVFLIAPLIQKLMHGVK